MDTAKRRLNSIGSTTSNSWRNAEYAEIGFRPRGLMGGLGRWGPPDDGHVKQRFDLVLGNVDVNMTGCRGRDECARGDG
jgi:hypothetical protein